MRIHESSAAPQTPAGRLIELNRELAYLQRDLDEANAKASRAEEAQQIDRARWYAAGIVDGEGSVTKTYRHKDESGSPSIRLSVSSTDWELIEEMQRIYRLLQIEYSVYEHNPRRPPQHSQCWTIIVRKATSIVRAAEVLPLQHKRKAQKLLESAEELRAKSRLGVLQGHGTNACYQRGCRCEPCRKAHSALNKAWKERQQTKSIDV